MYILLYQCWEISNFLLKRIQKVPKEKDDSVYENENANDAKEMQVSDNLKDPKTFALRATSSSIKDSLKKRTSEAYEKGIFGAPTFVSNNKIFWGQDRIEFVLKEASK